MDHDENATIDEHSVHVNAGSVALQGGLAVPDQPRGVVLFAQWVGEWTAEPAQSIRRANCNPPVWPRS